jgi:hypothetical protein
MDIRDSRLLEAVRGELALDPLIDDPSTIAVGVQAGFVTLRGTVPSVGQRRSAVRAADRCLGIAGIGNRLQVRTATALRPPDAVAGLNAITGMTSEIVVSALRRWEDDERRAG